MARWLWLLLALRASSPFVSVTPPSQPPSAKEAPTKTTRIRMEIDEPGIVGVPVPWPRYHSGGPDLKRSLGGLQAAGWRTGNKSCKRTLVSPAIKLYRFKKQKMLAKRPLTPGIKLFKL